MEKRPLVSVDHKKMRYLELLRGQLTVTGQKMFEAQFVNAEMFKI